MLTNRAVDRQGDDDRSNDARVGERRSRETLAGKLLGEGDWWKYREAVTTENESLLDVHCICFCNDRQFYVCHCAGVINERADATRSTGKDHRLAAQAFEGNWLAATQLSRRRADNPERLFEQRCGLQVRFALDPI